MRRARFVIAAAVAVLVLSHARAQPLVADLSSHLIAIDSSFTGTSVLLYGAVEEEGDLVIVVRGPEESVVVRRKGRVAGVWLNVDSLRFDGVPAYYAIATSRPLDEIASPDVLALYQIGLEHLRLTPAEPRDPAELAVFREALVRDRIRAGLYGARPGKVRFLSGRLFRTDLEFPSNVPTGSYQAQIMMFRDGEVLSAETTPLFVSKTGFQAEINYFARTRAPLYGLAAIAIALFAGWAGAAIFRRA